MGFSLWEAPEHPSATKKFGLFRVSLPVHLDAFKGRGVDHILAATDWHLA